MWRINELNGEWILRVLLISCTEWQFNNNKQLSEIYSIIIDYRIRLVRIKSIFKIYLARRTHHRSVSPATRKDFRFGSTSKIAEGLLSIYHKRALLSRCVDILYWKRMKAFTLFIIMVQLLCSILVPFQASAFVPPYGRTVTNFNRAADLLRLSARKPEFGQPGQKKISSKRRQQLGIGDDEDEYDLGVALSTNTDDTISKIVAGSFILVMIVLLVVGVVIPSVTDPGEGFCSPIQNGGRCWEAMNLSIHKTNT